MVPAQQKTHLAEPGASHVFADLGVVKPSGSRGGCLFGARCFQLGFLDVAFDLQAALGQFPVACLHQERVQTAAMFNGLQSMGRDTQAKAASERIADECHVAQVRTELAFRFVFGVAAQLPGERELARQLALPGHGFDLLAQRRLNPEARAGVVVQ